MLNDEIVNDQGVATYDFEFSRKQWAANQLLKQPDVDELLYGGAKGGGKVSPLDSMVCTNFGFKKLGDVHVNDMITNPVTGTTCKVIGEFPQPKQWFYRFKFDDGANLEVGLEHLWAYRVVGSKSKKESNRFLRYKVGTTKEIMNLVDNGKKIRFPLPEPIQFNKNGRIGKGLSPYSIGVLLGDGYFGNGSVTNIDKEVIAYLLKNGFKKTTGIHYAPNRVMSKKFKNWARNNGLIKNGWHARAWEKFLPEYIKHSPIEYRKAVLRGLMDTDGTVDERGRCYYCSTSRQLAEDVMYVVRSLGGKCRLRERVTEYTYKEEKKKGRVSYNLRIWLPKTSELFSVKRKKDRCTDKWNGGHEITRELVAIEKTRECYGKCIKVDTPLGLYVANDFIVTHNTVFGCMWSFAETIQIIKDFGLKPCKYPLVVGFMGRKQGVDFNNTTLNTWKTFIPESCYEIKKQEKLIVINKTVSILYGGMDDTATVKKFNSAEYGFYFVDQAEETVEDDLAMLRGTRRLKINGKELNYKGLLTANPALCWLKDAYIDTPQVGNRFIQALPSDNPFLPDSYVPQLQKAFKYRPELLRAYILGSWDDLDTANIVIPISNVKKNVCNDQHDKSVEYRITVADIADEGNDETVIYDMENTKIAVQEIYSHRNTMDTCGRLIAHAVKHKSNMIVVDKCGIGKGVFDRLNEIYGDDEKMDIYGYDGRLKAIDHLTYGNKKAESWFYAAEQMAESRCDIPNDPVLIKQLSSVPFRFKSRGKIWLLEKDKIKLILRGSPDRAETYVMALDALKVAKPYKKPDAYMREIEEEYDETADSC